MGNRKAVFQPTAGQFGFEIRDWPPMKFTVIDAQAFNLPVQVHLPHFHRSSNCFNAHMI